LVLVWFGCSSLTGKSLEAFRTYNNMPRWLPTLQDLLPVSIAPNTAPAIADAVLIDDLLLVLEWLLIVRD
jgi:hypothetical protein